MDLSNSLEKPPISDIKGKIEFNNVSFYYPSDLSKKLIINGINLNFESGKKIALIGESGCGKTTIVNLIERFYDVTDGEILLDGLDIRKYDIQYLRNLIGYVEQEPVLFNKTIRDNILFGRENYLKEKGEDIDKIIKNVCDESYVSEFINSLPNGLEYKVGTKGSKLSGGQKQRIAIARALLIKPKILILDEATSALDNKSEQIIQQAIDNITKMNITTIIIAHRLSTIKNADIIYTIKNGNVFEQGTHEELLNKGGYYTEIIRSQLIKEELENQNKEEELIRRISSLKRVNTDEEVHFERRDEELSKSTDNVVLNSCNIIKILCEYKCKFISGLIATIIYGAIPIVRGFFSGKSTVALNSDFQTVRYDDGMKYAIIFLIIGILHVISYFFFFYLLYSLGTDITKTYRNYLLKKYLQLHMAFFDINRNSPGSLVAKMAIDTVQLKYSFKLIIGNIIAALSTLITSLIFGVCYEYRITLITFAFLPFLIIITFIRRMFVQVDSPRAMAAGADGGRVLSECTTASRTIFSNNFSREALRLYLEAIDYITQRQFIDNFINGMSLSLITFPNYMLNATIFALGQK
jgi:ABC-type multidrug transport system fused ATPase/permease subunit